MNKVQIIFIKTAYLFIISWRTAVDFEFSKLPGWEAMNFAVLVDVESKKTVLLTLFAVIFIDQKKGNFAIVIKRQCWTNDTIWRFQQLRYQKWWSSLQFSDSSIDYSESVMCLFGLFWLGQSLTNVIKPNRNFKIDKRHLAV